MVGQGAPSVVNLEEAQAASAYNALLTSTQELGRRTWQGLLDGQREYDVVVQDRFLCNVMRPRFLTAGREQELRQISATVADLFERAGRLLLGSNRLLELIGATEQEMEIWSVDPGFPGFTVTSRLDSFMVGTVPRFIEYNAETPAGVAFSDVLTKIFQRLPAMQDWEPAHSMGTFNARRYLLDLLLWAFREWGGRDTPSVAVVDWEEGVMTRRDFELCAQYFNEHGVPTVIVDPRRLEYRAGKLWANDRQINLIYRRVLLHELLEKANEAQDLLQAYREGAVCIVNSPRSKILHKKAVMALLDDGHLDLDMTEEERRIIAMCIPWTRLLRAGETAYDGERVDLFRFCVDHQQRLAIKPSDEYGGKGVVLGWDVSPEEWVQALETNMGNEYIVQERVPVPEGSFPVWRDGGVALESLLVDTDPLLFRGEMGGILTRISASALLNVSAGTGSQVPTFVVPEGRG